MPSVFSKLVTYQFGKWKLNDCFYNTCYNKELSTFKKCKLVIGSLGLNGHFEFGGKNWTMKDFKKSPNDSHAWLEDEDGNIYDYIFEDYGRCAKFFGKKVTFPLNWEIIGISKKDLKEEYNLEYIPAKKEVQQFILDEISKIYELRFKFGIQKRVKMSLE